MGRVVTGDNPCYIMLRANNLRSHFGTTFEKKSGKAQSLGTHKLVIPNNNHTLPVEYSNTILRGIEPDERLCSESEKGKLVHIY